jgi:hypothetical protein
VDRALAARAIGAVVAAMSAHRARMEVQRDACYAIWTMTASPPNKAAAGAHGAVRAVLAALAAHPDEEAVRVYGCRALRALCIGNSQNVADARAAGAIEAVVAAMRALRDASDASQGGGGGGGGAARNHDDDVPYCILALHVLTHGDAAAAARAVRSDADVEALLARQAPHGREEEVAHALLAPQLRAAAQRHDDGGGSCADKHAACQRCAALRGSGAMCALPGCGARKRAEGTSNKKLLRCGTCRGACYCGPTHQRQDWARHKAECAAITQAAQAAAG